MTELKSVAVVGLGLMGGSLARDLAAAGVRVLGADLDPDTLRQARSAGVVTGTLDDDASTLAVDAVVLAVPVRRAPELLRRLAPRLAGATLVTDLGSTKRSIVEEAEAGGLGPRFVGSHPIAGDHRSGWAASRTGLYRDASVVLSPAPSTTPEAVARAIDLWTAVGATTEVLDAAEHDRRLAWSSHLPQTVATALAAALADAGVRPADLGPGGRDATRLAGSSPTMWTDIALDNAEAVGAALGRLEMHLAGLRRALNHGDEEKVRAFFERGSDWADG